MILPTTSGSAPWIDQNMELTQQWNWWMPVPPEGHKQIDGIGWMDFQCELEIFSVEFSWYSDRSYKNRVDVDTLHACIWELQFRNPANNHCIIIQAFEERVIWYTINNPAKAEYKMPDENWKLPIEGHFQLVKAYIKCCLTPAWGSTRDFVQDLSSQIKAISPWIEIQKSNDLEQMSVTFDSGKDRCIVSLIYNNVTITPVDPTGRLVPQIFPFTHDHKAAYFDAISDMQLQIWNRKIEKYAATLDLSHSNNNPWHRMISRFSNAYKCFYYSIRILRLKQGQKKWISWESTIAIQGEATSALHSILDDWSQPEFIDAHSAHGVMIAILNEYRLGNESQLEVFARLMEMTYEQFNGPGISRQDHESLPMALDGSPPSGTTPHPQDSHAWFPPQLLRILTQYKNDSEYLALSGNAVSPRIEERA